MVSVRGNKEQSADVIDISAIRSAHPDFADLLTDFVKHAASFPKEALSLVAPPIQHTLLILKDAEARRAANLAKREALKAAEAKRPIHFEAFVKDCLKVEPGCVSPDNELRAAYARYMTEHNVHRYEWLTPIELSQAILRLPDVEPARSPYHPGSTALGGACRGVRVRLGCADESIEPRTSWNREA